MSIHILKKKTQHKYKNNSVGQKQFSLNGTTRNAGWVGQTSLSRSILHQTSQKGHGGCCGTYNIIPISPPLLNLNNTNIIKSSVLNTKSMLMNKNRWVRRPQPYSTVKANSGNQEQHIQNVKKKELEKFDSCNLINYVNGHFIKKSNDYNCNACNQTNIFKTHFNNIFHAGNRAGGGHHIVSPENIVGPTSQSSHIEKIKQTCPIEKVFSLKKQNTPFAC